MVYDRTRRLSNRTIPWQSFLSLSLFWMLLCLFFTGNVTGFALKTNLQMGKRCWRNLICFGHDAPFSDNDMHTTLQFKIIPTARRKVLLNISGIVVGSQAQGISSANASVFGGDDRRQLDLCIVAVMRVGFWAESIATDIKISEGIPEKQVEAYLQARLGAKAALTRRVGGGATSRVYTLATLQLRGCLDDLVSYAKNKNRASDLRDDIIESLAAVVEFDGLETTTDQSPRSSLMIAQYKPEKAKFVYRLLSERVVPTVANLLNMYEPEVQERCKTYMLDNYPNEVPKKIQPPLS